MKKQIIFIVILVVILALFGWWLKTNYPLGKKLLDKPALTQEGTSGLTEDVNKKYQDKQRYSNFANIKSIKDRDITVQGLGSETGDKVLRIGRGAMIELLISNAQGQFRRDASVADLQAGQRILYYYVEVTNPIEVVALQILP